MKQERTRFTTIKKLKEFIKDLPDDAEIDIENTGESGFVTKTEIEKTIFDNGEAMFTVKIGAESGYVY